MDSHKRKPKRQTPSTIRFGGREYPVLDRLRIGRRTYLLLDHISRGGRERYLAYDPSAGPGGDFRAVLILPRSSAAVRHARVLKRLSVNNENVPRIFDYQAQRDRLVMVLDWIRGVTLDDYLEKVKSGDRQPPSPYEALRLVRGLAHGLYHFHHSRQVNHGDIKPENLILTSQRPRLVTIDFGSAWFAQDTINRSPGDGFSPAYGAPELQDRRSFVDFRADQFSASVVLFELITLQLPYDHLGGKAGRREWIAIARDKLMPPSRLASDSKRLPRSLWEGIDRVVLTGLALDPEDRYPTPRAWLDELDQVYAQMRHESHLSSAEVWLTRAVAWVASRLRKT